MEDSSLDVEEVVVMMQEIGEDDSRASLTAASCCW